MTLYIEMQAEPVLLSGALVEVNYTANYPTPLPRLAVTTEALRGYP